MTLDPDHLPDGPLGGALFLLLALTAVAGIPALFAWYTLTTAYRLWALPERRS